MKGEVKEVKAQMTIRKCLLSFSFFQTEIPLKLRSGSIHHLRSPCLSRDAMSSLSLSQGYHTNICPHG